MSRGRLLVVALSLAIHLGINRSEAFFLDGARLCPSSGESGRDTAIFCQPEPPTSEPLCSGSRSNCRKVYRYKSRHPVSSLSLNQSRVGLVRRRARNMAQMRRKKRRFLLLERFGSTKILRMGADFRNDRHAPAPSADEHATRATPSPTLRVETSRTRSVLMAAGTTSESKGMALAMSASRLCMNTTAEAPTSSGWDEPRLQQRRSRAECLPLSGRRREISGLWWPVFSPKKILKEMSSVEELSRFVDDEKWCLQDLSVVTWRGDGVQCSATGVAGRGVDTAPVLHPTVRAVLKRAVMGTSPSRHGDGRRIGLAIEVVKHTCLDDLLFVLFRLINWYHFTNCELHLKHKTIQFRKNKHQRLTKARLCIQTFFLVQIADGFMNMRTIALRHTSFKQGNTQNLKIPPT